MPANVLSASAKGYGVTGVRLQSGLPRRSPRAKAGKFHKLHKSLKNPSVFSEIFGSVAAPCAKDATRELPGHFWCRNAGRTAPLSNFWMKKPHRGFSSTKSTLY